MTPPSGTAFWLLTLPLAMGQLVLWGTTYFSFTLFINPISAELGWSTAEISAAFSLSLAVAGLLALPMGRWIDQHGARLPMVAGAFGTAMLFVLWALVNQYWEFVAVWLCLGVCGAAVLTQPAYAALVQALNDRSNQAITICAFATGLSAAIFVPLGSALISGFGWRGALVWLAGANGCCALLHAFVIKATSHADLACQAAEAPLAGWRGGNLHRAVRSSAFWAITLAFAANSALTSALAVYLVPLQVLRGYSTAEVTAAVAMAGPAQLAVRLLMAAAGRRSPDSKLASVVTIGLQLLAILVLLGCDAGSSPWWLIYLFSLMNGVSAGAAVVVRAVITTDMFGQEEYASIQGALQTALMLARAAAPVMTGLAWSLGDYRSVLWLLLGLGAFSFLAMTVAFVPRNSVIKSDPPTSRRRPWRLS